MFGGFPVREFCIILSDEGTSYASLFKDSDGSKLLNEKLQGKVTLIIASLLELIKV